MGRPSRCAGAFVTALAIGMVFLVACAGPASRPPASEAPDFGLVAFQGEVELGGTEPKLSTVLGQGKPLVLNFWAGDCPPCRAEMPAFQKVADEFEGKVLFLGVDVGVFTGLGTQESARRLLRELAIRYPAAYAVDAVPLRRYNVRSMPTTIFLTSEGRVIERFDGMLLEPQLRSSVQRLLAAS